MKIEIFKTSDMFNFNSPPCKNAFQEMDGDKYYIEVDTLKDLLTLVNKYGPIILDKGHNSQYSIEIYDDYRE